MTEVHPPSVQSPTGSGSAFGLTPADAENHGLDVMVCAFRKLMTDGDELLKATAQCSVEGLSQARERFQVNLEGAQKRFLLARSVLQKRALVATDLTQHYIQQNPWTSVGAAATVGLLVGILLSSD